MCRDITKSKWDTSSVYLLTVLAILVTLAGSRGFCQTIRACFDKQEKQGDLPGYLKAIRDSGLNTEAFFARLKK